MNEFKYWERKDIPISIGTMSLIGTSKMFPVGWGNYFWFESGERCLNFWAENIKEAGIRFCFDNVVKCLVCTAGKNSWAIVDDDRIPHDWFYNKLCFTGCCPPSLEPLKEIYAYIGDTENELEQFIDPKSYWAKRGGEYKENGVIVFKVEAKPRKLMAEWKVEQMEPIKIVAAPFQWE